MATEQPAGERPTWVDDQLFPFQSRFVEVDGNVVHYVDEGAGPTLLLLHGNPVWSFVYRDVIAILKDRFRCIAVDFPGFGLSTAAPGYRYTARDHAELLVSFIDRLDLAHVTLVGHNWGGPLGLYAGLQRPNLFDRLVLTNTWAWPLNGDLSSELFSRGMGGSIGRALIKQFNLLVNHFIPAAHKRRKLSADEMAHYRHAMPTPQLRHACAVLPGELVGARRFFTDLAERLDPLQKLPTLIVWADADPIFTDKYRTRLEATFPHHTTTVLHGVGHFPQSDAPPEFSDAIAMWWTEEATQDTAAR
ncbi:alpha/beta fold hydrolase [Mycolicibacterium fluoranthenivorans]|uniref:Haloalkane dehalogenase n=1 Tax=Mycolicibacterium fluoranthenivorans TaxID=258505 RepID=A0A7X5TZP7_9MYCO|nr:alpha/beta fold hydrolase [Mycolicibacterium fluoranthenivorans]MCV7358147.1 alpha/beta fold hydrolase [Mycolicibacterium fluoranthenivorans]NIH95733.1 haloalkane dehalogenase [Mycolicibacterium fluoranthenivorans]